jgi:hypothetical protein
VPGEKVQSLDKSLYGHSWPKGYDRDVVYSPDLWAQAMQAAGEENGYDLVYARESLLRVRSRLEGKMADCEFEYVWSGNLWKP